MKKTAILLLTLGFTLFALNKSYAQWSFTFSYRMTGKCDAGGIQLPVVTIPSVIPTLSDCEQIRAMLANLSVTSGSCTISVICTPCTGKDISSSGGGSTITAGTVSVNNLTQGSAYFYGSASQEIAEWSKNLDKQLEQMSNSKFSNINTGDIKHDKAYELISGEVLTMDQPKKEEEDPYVYIVGKDGSMNRTNARKTGELKLNPAAFGEAPSLDLGNDGKILNPPSNSAKRAVFAENEIGDPYTTTQEDNFDTDLGTTISDALGGAVNKTITYASIGIGGAIGTYINTIKGIQSIGNAPDHFIVKIAHTILNDIREYSKGNISLNEFSKRMVSTNEKAKTRIDRELSWNY